MGFSCGGGVIYLFFLNFYGALMSCTAYYRYYGTKIMRISFQILPCISLLHVNV